MKTMKKTILILTVAFTAFLSSCNKDEDTPTPTPDPVIGTWKLESIKEGTTEQNLNDCDKTSTVAFTENTATFTWYGESTMNNDTSCNQIDIKNFTWENLDDSNYKFTDSSSSESFNTIITFEENTIIIDTPDEGVVITYSKQ